MTPVEPADNDTPVCSGDQAGADVSARLLLALTALYVQRSNHTIEEQQQYTELALGLIERAGPSACADAAARLLRHPDAPPAVVERLGAPLPECPGDDHGQRDAASDRSGRDRLPEAGSQVESDLPVPSDGVAGEEPAARKRHHEEPLTPELGADFFAASPAERRRMLLAITGAGGAAKAAPEGPRRFHVRIDIAPWRSRTGAFVRDFERLIDAPNSLCMRILNDPSGEPMVVAARATGMPAGILQRILLLVSPQTHHSVQRVYELTELYHALDAGLARDLLAAWRKAAMNAPRSDVDPSGGAPAAPTDLRARFRALNARIESKTLTSRSGRENAGRRGLPSR